MLTGSNGAGKTNLLEALSFLVPGQGLRRARLDEVARRESGFADGAGKRRPWAVAVRVNTPDGEIDIGGLFIFDRAKDMWKYMAKWEVRTIAFGSPGGAGLPTEGKFHQEDSNMDVAFGIYWMILIYVHRGI